jgi:hypothetical protein
MKKTKPAPHAEDTASFHVRSGSLQDSRNERKIHDDRKTNYY